MTRGHRSSTPPPAAAPRAGTMLRGSAWTLGGYAAGQALRFLGNLVLTRVLFPAAFGEMTLVMTIVQGLQMFSDIGAGPAIVQGARGDDPRFLRTAWTLQCTRGAILWAVALLISRPVAALYGQPSLAWYIPVAGLCTVFAGFESIAVFTQQRHLRIERVTAVAFSAQAITVISTVAFSLVARSWLGPDDPSAVWALVAGTVLGGVARLALTHLVLEPFQHRFLLERDALRTLFGFGRWIFLSTLLTFLAGQSDRLFFGKVVPLGMLGVYGVAAALAALPAQAIQRLASSVLFPGFSRMAEGADFARSVHRARMPALLGGAALVTGLVACGPFLVHVLYDDRYLEAGWMVQYLAAAAWLQILESTNGAVLLAQGRVSWHAADNAAKLVGLVLLVPAGFWAHGFHGAVVGLVAADLLKYVTSAIGVTVRGIRVVRTDVGLSALIALVSGAATLGGQALRGAGGGEAGALLAAGVGASAAWGALAWTYLWRRRGPQPPPPTAAPILTVRACEPGRDP